MKANELMIGDWVCYDGDVEYSCPIKIEGMDVSCDSCITSDRDDVGFNGVIPIPLTVEILEKNGIPFNGELPYPCDHVKVCHNVNGWFVTFCECYGFDINYVHELQHALRLCRLNNLADNFKI